MFSAFRLGAVWVPTNFRLMPDEVAYLASASAAKAFLCHGDFPDHAKVVSGPAFVWRIGEEGTFGERRVSEAIAVKGVKVAGLLPEALQDYSAYAAAIPASSTDPAAARAFIAALASPAMAQRWRANGFDPPK